MIETSPSNSPARSRKWNGRIRTSMFYVDVKDETGKVINYACEVGAPNSLYRNGWRKDSLKSGDSVSIEGWRARDGSNTVNAGTVLLPGGKRVFSGSADE